MTEVTDFSEVQIIEIKKRSKPLMKQWGETIAFAKELEKEFKKKYGITSEAEKAKDASNLDTK